MISMIKLLFLSFLCVTLSSALGSMCTSSLTPNPSNNQFWVEYIKHEGTAPFNANPSGYTVYRNVKDFGARGDGTSDDTDAINSAISSSGRCGQNCDSSTVVPALVYFPAGTYLISRPIVQYYFTQFVGDALNPPTLLGSAGFAGIALIDADPYIAGGANWFTNQNNFYRQVRNFVLDVSKVSGSATGIHWQVAQSTSLTNVVFKMATDGRNHQGMFMENGSGGFMSDLVFIGGKLGMWIGNQQFTFRNITINNAQTAMTLGWNWGFTFKTLNINNCQLGFDMSAGNSGSQQVGSAIIIDATITNTPVFIKTGTSSTSLPHTSGSLILDNIKLSNVGVAVQGPSGTLIGAVSQIDSWGQGQFYMDNSGKGTFKQENLTPKPSKPSALLNPTGEFFERTRPQYENYAVTDFVSVKSQGAKGDGKSDDTATIQATLNQYAGCKIVYFPAGVYLLSSTVLVPAGSRIVGEVWSVISATGANFANPSSPTPMLKIGNAGDEGLVEISDILFSTQGRVPGAVLVEWNIRDPAGQQGASGMWDSHFRIGGALGTNLDSTHCAKFTAPTDQCQGAHTCLHLTASSSAYLENVWVWTADHDLDNTHAQISIFNARGVIVESSNGPVWMYGTASEHNVMYQYNVVNAKNVLLAMIQTETPYFQSNPMAPVPFVSQPAFHDPDFSRCGSNTKCAMAWGLMIQGSQNVFVYGAGLYNFFQNYDQGCLTGENCQDAMVDIDASCKNLFLYNLNTKATTSMISINEVGSALQADNRNTFCSTIAGFFAQSQLGEISFLEK